MLENVVKAIETVMKILLNVLHILLMAKFLPVFDWLK